MIAALLCAPQIVGAQGVEDFASSPAAAAQPPAMLSGIQPSAEVPDTDGDGLPDTWESSVGLGSASALGPDGPEGDPDLEEHEGASNVHARTPSNARA